MDCINIRVHVPTVKIATRTVIGIPSTNTPLCHITQDMNRIWIWTCTMYLRSKL